MLSVVLFVVSGVLRDRGVGGGTPRRTADGHPDEAGGHARCPKAKQPARGPLDDDGLDDEIAEILKRRGIS